MRFDPDMKQLMSCMAPFSRKLIMTSSSIIIIVNSVQHGSRRDVMCTSQEIMVTPPFGSELAVTGSAMYPHEGTLTLVGTGGGGVMQPT